MDFGHWPHKSMHHWGRVAAEIPAGGSKLLDFGCNDGALLFSVSGLVDECFGCDVDPVSIACAEEKHPVAEYEKIEVGQKLPYQDASFDVITFNSVLEHVPDPSFVMTEAHRILRPGGRIIVTVPHKGLFEFADPGNLKFRFPVLHKAFHKTFQGQKGEDYDESYTETHSAMIGCHTNEWHVHFSTEGIEELLSTHFSILGVYGFRLFHPLYMILQTFATSLIGRRSQILDWLIRKDDLIQAGRFSDYIMVVAVKR